MTEPEKLPEHLPMFPRGMEMAYDKYDAFYVTLWEAKEQAEFENETLRTKLSIRTGQIVYPDAADQYANVRNHIKIVKEQNATLTAKVGELTKERDSAIKAVEEMADDFVTMFLRKGVHFRKTDLDIILAKYLKPVQKGQDDGT
jgi:hypothetical protein